MDISVVNQAGVRKNFYEFPSDVGMALIHAGLALQIAKSVTAKPVPHWYVCQKPVLSNEQWMGDYLLAWTDGSGAVMYFSGKPEAYLKKPPVHCGLEAPRAVLEQYARVQGTTALDPDWVREVSDRQKAADAQRQQKEREQTHRLIG